MSLVTSLIVTMFPTRGARRPRKCARLAALHVVAHGHREVAADFPVDRVVAAIERGIRIRSCGPG